MSESVVAAKSLGLLLRYLLQWLRSLAAASQERKAACTVAVEGVIAGVRRTERYLLERKLGNSDASVEGDLAVMWTELGFQLEALGIRKLAKRCDVKGVYWSSPHKFSETFWDQADICLASVAKLAREIRADIRINGAPKK